MQTKRPAHGKDGDGVRVIAAEEDICVWMRAKVVNFKLCSHTYDCATCPFDAAMRKAWAQEDEKT